MSLLAKKTVCNESVVHLTELKRNNGPLQQYSVLMKSY